MMAFAYLVAAWVQFDIAWIRHLFNVENADSMHVRIAVLMGSFAIGWLAFIGIAESPASSEKDGIVDLYPPSKPTNVPQSPPNNGIAFGPKDRPWLMNARNGENIGIGREPTSQPPTSVTPAPTPEAGKWHQ
jgi:hypothetical protein